MRFVSSFVITFFVASISVAGDYGTITVSAMGQSSGHSMGSGGRFDWNVVDLNTNASWDPSWNLELTANKLHTFCIELAETVGSGIYQINSLENAPNNPAAMTTAMAADVEKLADNYFSTAVLGTALQAGAFQYALWEIIHGDYDATTKIDNSFWGISAAARNLAGTYLAGLGALNDLPETKSLAIVRDGKQDQLIQVSVVPELSSIAVWSLLVGFVGLLYQRYNRMPL